MNYLLVCLEKLKEYEMKKLVLVTGGTRGLGLAVVERLVVDGYKVIAVGRKKSEELSKLIDETQSSDIVFEKFDLNDVEKIHEFISQIVKQHGNIYGLVNNAALGNDGVLGTMHDSEIDTLVRVNVLATILMTKYVSRTMMRKRTGRIINISSIIASTGFSGLSVYGATKASLNGFTKSLSRELGKIGITVNSVAPGYMATDMTKGIADQKLQSIVRRAPMKKLATVEDVAGSVAFLLSDDAVMINGTVITVDGGSTA